MRALEELKVDYVCQGHYILRGLWTRGILVEENWGGRGFLEERFFALSLRGKFRGRYEERKGYVSTATENHAHSR